MSDVIRNGDVILVDRHAQGWISVALKFGAKLRYGFYDPHTQYSHAAIVYSAPEHGPVTIVEATATSGVQLALLSKYKPSEYDVVHTNVSDDDFRQVRRYLDDVLAKRTSYDFWTYAGLSVYAVTGTKLCIQHAGSAICSGLVCDALTRAGLIWDRPPYACTPADISAHLQKGAATWRAAAKRRARVAA